MQCGLHAASIHWRRGGGRALDTALATGEQQLRVAMHLPEVAQEPVGGVRQGHEAVPVALGVADMHAGAYGIDIADLQAQPFAQAQSQTVEGEVEHPVADDAGGGEQAPGFLDRDDVGQALAARWLDQAGCNPGFLQDMRVVELQAVQVELDGGPRVRGNEISEVVGELRCGQFVDPMVKVVAHAANGAGVRLDGLGLQSLELEVLEMRLVLPVKVLGDVWRRHAGLSSRNIAESFPRD